MRKAVAERQYISLTDHSLDPANSIQLTLLTLHNFTPSVVHISITKPAPISIFM